MGSECEVKLRLHDVGAVRAALQRCGAQALGVVLEDNTLFDTQDGHLQRADCGLRMRCITVWPSPAAPQAHDTAVTVLTFKGPRTAGDDGIKLRPEWETNVDSPAALTELLGLLGLRAQVCFEKRRESWRFADATVTLDELPLLGWWSEIEAPSKDAVARVRETLGMADLPAEEDTYVALAARNGSRNPVGVLELRFRVPELGP